MQQKQQDTEGNYDIEELELTPPEEVTVTIDYAGRIQQALMQLEAEQDKYLSPTALETYSPKFLQILNNLLSSRQIGLHLIYSQFRTLEGIGILSLILKVNGFAQFKIAKVRETWQIDMSVEDMGKPTFVLYTGTENPEEKEVIRNIFNGNWSAIQPGLKAELEAIASNNLMGEIIKIIMITASGAEGISLSNVRYVHITEPYWHPVRIQQVIGRARRICSHKDLPQELQTVEVFLYLMTFTDKQLEGDNYGELKKYDVGKRGDNLARPLTSDEALYEIATIKDDINKAILKNMKEASIDCNVHTTLGGQEDLQCFSFNTIDPDKFSYIPLIGNDEVDAVVDTNIKEEKFIAKSIPIPGIGNVAYDPKSGKVYSLDSYERYRSKKGGILLQIGTLERKENKYEFVPM